MTFHDKAMTISADVGGGCRLTLEVGIGMLTVEANTHSEFRLNLLDAYRSLCVLAQEYYTDEQTALHMKIYKIKSYAL